MLKPNTIPNGLTAYNMRMRLVNKNILNTRSTYIWSNNQLAKLDLTNFTSPRVLQYDPQTHQWSPAILTRSQFPNTTFEVHHNSSNVSLDDLRRFTTLSGQLTVNKFKPGHIWIDKQGGDLQIIETDATGFTQNSFENGGSITDDTLKDIGAHILSNYGSNGTAYLYYIARNIHTHPIQSQYTTVDVSSFVNRVAIPDRGTTVQLYQSTPYIPAYYSGSVYWVQTYQTTAEMRSRNDSQIKILQ